MRVHCRLVDPMMNLAVDWNAFRLNWDEAIQSSASIQIDRAIGLSRLPIPTTHLDDLAPSNRCKSFSNGMW